MKTKTNNSKTVKMVALGATLAGIAAGAYFFLGPKGKQHQKHVKAWAIKMKGDVIEKLESAKEVSESAYHAIIDSVAEKYARSKKIGKDEVKALANDLKKHWKTIIAK
jgi:hypothetical protein